MRIRIIPLLVVVGLAATACSHDPSAPTVAAPVSQAPSAAATTATAAPTTAAATGTTAPGDVGGDAGKLTLDLVERQVEPVLSKDPDCPKGEWTTDVSNLPDRYRSGAKQFAQYDCHLRAGEAVPHRVAQAVYITFADPRMANDYADNEAGLSPSLVAYNTVVVIGSGLPTVNIRQTLRTISQACVCGHVS
ncbi:hypothetical protein [Dactylosporangium sp. CA-092794]|uniref:hypothetical protein n=1 Tax=Dactylosporangium sp. CA-092794 TaxID=3239929 RepID=UPI003D89B854